MARGQLPDEQAFAQMKAASQHLNIKLHVLAEHVIETGELLDTTPPR